MSLDVTAYRKWLAQHSGLSQKAQNDLVSRLRRADSLVSFSEDQQGGDHLALLQQNPKWSSIPRASQQSILGAAKRYIEWRNNQ